MNLCFVPVDNFSYLDERLTTLEHECQAKLQERGFSPNEIELERFLHLRYEGTDCGLMCSANNLDKGLPKHGDFETEFLNR